MIVLLLRPNARQFNFEKLSHYWTPVKERTCLTKTSIDIGLSMQQSPAGMLCLFDKPLHNSRTFVVVPLSRPRTTEHRLS